MYTRLSISCLAFLFILCFTQGLHAQEKNAMISTGQDTNTVKQLLKESGTVRITSPDSALQILNEALRISKVLQYDEGIASAMLSMAFCYQDKNEYLKSKSILALAYPYSTRLSSKNKRIMPALFNGWASNYAATGNNDSALAYFYKALSEIEKTKLNDTFLLAQIYSNMGTAWLQKSETQRGLMYHKKAEVLVLQLKDSLYLANIQSNIGVEYLNLKDTAKAIQYLNSALSIFREKGNIRGSRFIYYALGTAQADPKKAIAYHEAALAYDSVSAFAAGVYQCLGGAYYQLQNYRKAAGYYLKAQSICEREQLLTHRLANYSALSSIYERLGDFKSAFTYQVAYANLNDSLLNVENSKVNKQLELKFRTAEKDKEIARNKIQLYSLQRRITLMASGVVLLLGLGFAFWRMSRQKQKLQAERIRNFEQQQKIEHLHSKMQGEEESTNLLGSGATFT